MTFKWQGRAYNTAAMTVFETDNPAMPVVYLTCDGDVFAVDMDRLEGIEIRMVSREEAVLLAQRHGFAELLATTERQQCIEEEAGVQQHVLIVEDDGLSRHALSQLLQRSGYQTAFAATVAEAESKLVFTTKWLILDLQLPDGKGTTLLERIRKQNLPVKVAITTGQTNHALLSHVTSLHPDAIFYKPLDLSQVMHWMEAA